MFARSLHMGLKPESAAKFTNLIENEVIPSLQKQQGFQGEMVFVDPGGTEAIRITLWDKEENADAYQGGDQPEVLKSLANVVDGNPRVRSYRVSNSTFHKIVGR